jgi:hypothetical protein
MKRGNIIQAVIYNPMMWTHGNARVQTKGWYCISMVAYYGEDPKSGKPYKQKMCMKHHYEWGHGVEDQHNKSHPTLCQ